MKELAYAKKEISYNYRFEMEVGLLFILPKQRLSYLYPKTSKKKWET